jgi:selenocysteine-specific elongation factor
MEGLAERAIALVEAHHAAPPRDPGAPREALRSALARDAGVAEIDARVLRLAIGEAARQGRLVMDRERVRAASHDLRLDDAERALRDSIEARLSAAGLEPPVLKDLVEAVRKPAATVRNVLGLLSREGRVVRVKEDLYFHRAAIEDLAGRLTAFLRERGRITPAEYKSLTGASRKYTVPLMEHFDEHKLTIRVGDERRLRRPA